MSTVSITREAWWRTEVVLEEEEMMISEIITEEVQEMKMLVGEESHGQMEQLSQDSLS
jgi:hypothetical protein